MTSLFTQCSRIDHLSTYYNFCTTVDVLRLDELHPTISGNKWFKLKYYVEEAQEQQKNCLVTFGGAYSNHIVATAATAHAIKMKSIGIIRGEKPDPLSPTLQEAIRLNMDLFFVSREVYKEKILPEAIFQRYHPNDLYHIPEGGYGEKGALGAADILLRQDTSSYTHIVTAVGTGTTTAGLLQAAWPLQKVVAISVLKNNFSVEQEIIHLVTPAKSPQLNLIHDYHFGGYAKSGAALFRFMNNFFEVTGIPTDFVYTAKAFFATLDLLKKEYFLPTDKILLIHTGGLQGNRSLQKEILNY